MLRDLEGYPTSRLMRLAALPIFFVDLPMMVLQVNEKGSQYCCKFLWPPFFQVVVRMPQSSKFLWQEY